MQEDAYALDSCQTSRIRSLSLHMRPPLFTTDPSLSYGCRPTTKLSLQSLMGITSSISLHYPTENHLAQKVAGAPDQQPRNATSRVHYTEVQMPENEEIKLRRTNGVAYDIQKNEIASSTTFTTPRHLTSQITFILSHAPPRTV